MVRQTREDATAALRANLGFLRRSGEAFDDGEVSEAMRIAVTIRVLVHETRRSHSILGILGVKDRLRLIDTADRPPTPDAEGVLHWSMGFGLAAVTIVDGALQYIAPLDGRPRLEPALFEQWWERPIVADMAQNAFSRSDMVLHLANQEGGAHYDEELRQPYADLAKSNSLGYYFSDAAGDAQPAGSPVPANVRQIGWELQTTIEEQLTHLL